MVVGSIGDGYTPETVLRGDLAGTVLPPKGESGKDCKQIDQLESEREKSIPKPRENGPYLSSGSGIQSDSLIKESVASQDNQMSSEPESSIPTSSSDITVLRDTNDSATDTEIYYSLNERPERIPVQLSEIQAVDVERTRVAIPGPDLDKDILTPKHSPKVDDYIVVSLGEHSATSPIEKVWPISNVETVDSAPIFGPTDEELNVIQSLGSDDASLYGIDTTDFGDLDCEFTHLEKVPHSPELFEAEKNLSKTRGESGITSKARPQLFTNSKTPIIPPTNPVETRHIECESRFPGHEESANSDDTTEEMVELGVTLDKEPYIEDYEMISSSEQRSDLESNLRNYVPGGFQADETTESIDDDVFERSIEESKLASTFPREDAGSHSLTGDVDDKKSALGSRQNEAQLIPEFLTGKHGMIAFYNRGRLQDKAISEQAKITSDENLRSKDDQLNVWPSDLHADLESKKSIIPVDEVVHGYEIESDKIALKRRESLSSETPENFVEKSMLPDDNNSALNFPGEADDRLSSSNQISVSRHGHRFAGQNVLDTNDEMKPYPIGSSGASMPPKRDEDDICKSKVKKPLKSDKLKRDENKNEIENQPDKLRNSFNRKDDKHAIVAYLNPCLDHESRLLESFSVEKTEIHDDENEDKIITQLVESLSHSNVSASKESEDIPYRASPEAFGVRERSDLNELSYQEEYDTRPPDQEGKPIDYSPPKYEISEIKSEQLSEFSPPGVHGEPRDYSNLIQLVGAKIKPYSTGELTVSMTGYSEGSEGNSQTKGGAYQENGKECSSDIRSSQSLTREPIDKSERDRDFLGHCKSSDTEDAKLPKCLSEKNGVQSCLKQGQETGPPADVSADEMMSGSNVLDERVSYESQMIEYPSETLQAKDMLESKEEAEISAFDPSERPSKPVLNKEQITPQEDDLNTYQVEYLQEIDKSVKKPNVGQISFCKMKFEKSIDSDINETDIFRVRNLETQPDTADIDLENVQEALNVKSLSDVHEIGFDSESLKDHESLMPYSELSSKNLQSPTERSDVTDKRYLESQSHEVTDLQSDMDETPKVHEGESSEFDYGIVSIIDPRSNIEFPMNEYPMEGIQAKGTFISSGERARFGISDRKSSEKEEEDGNDSIRSGVAGDSSAVHQDFGSPKSATSLDDSQGGGKNEVNPAYFPDSSSRLPDITESNARNLILSYKTLISETAIMLDKRSSDENLLQTVSGEFNSVSLNGISHDESLKQESLGSVPTADINVNAKSSQMILVSEPWGFESNYDLPSDKEKSLESLKNDSLVLTANKSGADVDSLPKDEYATNSLENYDQIALLYPTDLDIRIKPTVAQISSSIPSLEKGIPASGAKASEKSKYDRSNLEPDSSKCVDFPTAPQGDYDEAFISTGPPEKFLENQYQSDIKKGLHALDEGLRLVDILDKVRLSEQTFPGVCADNDSVEKSLHPPKFAIIGVYEELGSSERVRVDSRIPSNGVIREKHDVLKPDDPDPESSDPLRQVILKSCTNDVVPVLPESIITESLNGVKVELPATIKNNKEKSDIKESEKTHQMSVLTGESNEDDVISSKGDGTTKFSDRSECFKVEKCTELVEVADIALIEQNKSDLKLSRALKNDEFIPRPDEKAHLNKSLSHQEALKSGKPETSIHRKLTKDSHISEGIRSEDKSEASSLKSYEMGPMGESIAGEHISIDLSGDLLEVHSHPDEEIVTDKNEPKFPETLKPKSQDDIASDVFPSACVLSVHDSNIAKKCVHEKKEESTVVSDEKVTILTFGSGLSGENSLTPPEKNKKSGSLLLERMEPSHLEKLLDDKSKAESCKSEAEESSYDLTAKFSEGFDNLGVDRQEKFLLDDSQTESRSAGPPNDGATTTDDVITLKSDELKDSKIAEQRKYIEEIPKTSESAEKNQESNSFVRGENGSSHQTLLEVDESKAESYKSEPERLNYNLVVTCNESSDKLGIERQDKFLVAESQNDLKSAELSGDHATTIDGRTTSKSAEINESRIAEQPEKTETSVCGTEVMSLGDTEKKLDVYEPETSAEIVIDEASIVDDSGKDKQEHREVSSQILKSVVIDDFRTAEQPENTEAFVPEADRQSSPIASDTRPLEGTTKKSGISEPELSTKIVSNEAPIVGDSRKNKHEHDETSNSLIQCASDDSDSGKERQKTSVSLIQQTTENLNETGRGLDEINPYLPKSLVKLSVPKSPSLPAIRLLPRIDNDPYFSAREDISASRATSIEPSSDTEYFSAIDCMEDLFVSSDADGRGKTVGDRASIPKVEYSSSEETLYVNNSDFEEGEDKVRGGTLGDADVGMVAGGNGVSGTTCTDEFARNFDVPRGFSPNPVHPQSIDDAARLMTERDISDVARKGSGPIEDLNKPLEHTNLNALGEAVVGRIDILAASGVEKYGGISEVSITSSPDGAYARDHRIASHEEFGSESSDFDKRLVNSGEDLSGRFGHICSQEFEEASEVKSSGVGIMPFKKDSDDTIPNKEPAGSLESKGAGSSSNAIAGISCADRDASSGAGSSTDALRSEVTPVTDSSIIDKERDTEDYRGQEHVDNYEVGGRTCQDELASGEFVARNFPTEEENLDEVDSLVLKSHNVSDSSKPITSEIAGISCVDALTSKSELLSLKLTDESNKADMGNVEYDLGRFEDDASILKLRTAGHDLNEHEGFCQHKGDASDITGEIDGLNFLNELASKSEFGWKSPSSFAKPESDKMTEGEIAKCADIREPDNGSFTGMKGVITPGSHSNHFAIVTVGQVGDRSMDSNKEDVLVTREGVPGNICCISSESSCQTSEKSLDKGKVLVKDSSNLCYREGSYSDPNKAISEIGHSSGLESMVTVKSSIQETCKAPIDMESSEHAERHSPVDTAPAEDSMNKIDTSKQSDSDCTDVDKGIASGQYYFAEGMQSDIHSSSCNAVADRVCTDELGAKSDIFATKLPQTHSKVSGDIGSEIDDKEYAVSRLSQRAPGDVETSKLVSGTEYNNRTETSKKCGELGVGGDFELDYDAPLSAKDAADITGQSTGISSSVSDREQSALSVSEKGDSSMIIEISAFNTEIGSTNKFRKPGEFGTTDILGDNISTMNGKGPLATEEQSIAGYLSGGAYKSLEQPLDVLIDKYEDRVFERSREMCDNQSGNIKSPHIAEPSSTLGKNVGDERDYIDKEDSKTEKEETELVSRREVLATKSKSPGSFKEYLNKSDIDESIEEGAKTPEKSDFTSIVPLKKGNEIEPNAKPSEESEYPVHEVSKEDLYEDYSKSATDEERNESDKIMATVSGLSCIDKLSTKFDASIFKPPQTPEKGHVRSEKGEAKASIISGSILGGFSLSSIQEYECESATKPSAMEEMKVSPVALVSKKPDLGIEISSGIGGQTSNKEFASVDLSNLSDKFSADRGITGIEQKSDTSRKTLTDEISDDDSRTEIDSERLKESDYVCSHSSVFLYLPPKDVDDKSSPYSGKDKLRIIEDNFPGDTSGLALATSESPEPLVIDGRSCSDEFASKLNLGQDLQNNEHGGDKTAEKSNVHIAKNSEISPERPVMENLSRENTLRPATAKESVMVFAPSPDNAASSAIAKSRNLEEIFKSGNMLTDSLGIVEQRDEYAKSMAGDLKDKADQIAFEDTSSEFTKKVPEFEGIGKTLPHSLPGDESNVVSGRRIPGITGHACTEELAHKIKLGQDLQSGKNDENLIEDALEIKKKTTNEDGLENLSEMENRSDIDNESRRSTQQTGDEDSSIISMPRTSEKPDKLSDLVLKPSPEQSEHAAVKDAELSALERHDQKEEDLHKMSGSIFLQESASKSTAEVPGFDDGKGKGVNANLSQFLLVDESDLIYDQGILPDHSSREDPAHMVYLEQKLQTSRYGCIPIEGTPVIRDQTATDDNETEFVDDLTRRSTQQVEKEGLSANSTSRTTDMVGSGLLLEAQSESQQQPGYVAELSSFEGSDKVGEVSGGTTNFILHEQTADQTTADDSKFEDNKRKGETNDLSQGLPGEEFNLIHDSGELTGRSRSGNLACVGKLEQGLHCSKYGHNLAEDTSEKRGHTVMKEEVGKPAVYETELSDESKIKSAQLAGNEDFSAISVPKTSDKADKPSDLMLEAQAELQQRYEYAGRMNAQPASFVRSDQKNGESCGMADLTLNVNPASNSTTEAQENDGSEDKGIESNLSHGLTKDESGALSGVIHTFNKDLAHKINLGHELKCDDNVIENTSEKRGKATAESKLAKMESPQQTGAESFTMSGPSEKSGKSNDLLPEFKADNQQQIEHSRGKKTEFSVLESFDRMREELCGIDDSIFNEQAETKFISETSDVGNSKGKEMDRNLSHGLSKDEFSVLPEAGNFFIPGHFCNDEQEQVLKIGKHAYKMAVDTSETESKTILEDESEMPSELDYGRKIADELRNGSAQQTGSDDFPMLGTPECAKKSSDLILAPHAGYQQRSKCAGGKDASTSRVPSFDGRGDKEEEVKDEEKTLPHDLWNDEHDVGDCAEILNFKTSGLQRKLSGKASTMFGEDEVNKFTIRTPEIDERKANKLGETLSPGQTANESNMMLDSIKFAEGVNRKIFQEKFANKSSMKSHSAESRKSTGDVKSTLEDENPDQFDNVLTDKSHEIKAANEFKLKSPSDESYDARGTEDALKRPSEYRDREENVRPSESAVEIGERLSDQTCADIVSSTTALQSAAPDAADMHAGSLVHESEVASASKDFLLSGEIEETDGKPRKLDDSNVFTTYSGIINDTFDQSGSEGHESKCLPVTDGLSMKNRSGLSSKAGAEENLMELANRSCQVQLVNKETTPHMVTYSKEASNSKELNDGYDKLNVVSEIGSLEEIHKSKSGKNSEAKSFGAEKKSVIPDDKGDVDNDVSSSAKSGNVDISTSTADELSKKEVAGEKSVRKAESSKDNNRKRSRKDLRDQMDTLRVIESNSPELSKDQSSENASEPMGDAENEENKEKFKDDHIRKADGNGIEGSNIVDEFPRKSDDELMTAESLRPGLRDLTDVSCTEKFAKNFAFASSESHDSGKRCKEGHANNEFSQPTDPCRDINESEFVDEMDLLNVTKSDYGKMYNDPSDEVIIEHTSENLASNSDILRPETGEEKDKDDLTKTDVGEIKGEFVEAERSEIECTVLGEQEGDKFTVVERPRDMLRGVSGLSYTEELEFKSETASEPVESDRISTKENCAIDEARSEVVFGETSRSFSKTDEKLKRLACKSSQDEVESKVVVPQGIYDEYDKLHILSKSDPPDESNLPFSVFNENSSLSGLDNIPSTVNEKDSNKIIAKEVNIDDTLEGKVIEPCRDELANKSLTQSRNTESTLDQMDSLNITDSNLLGLSKKASSNRAVDSNNDGLNDKNGIAPPASGYENVEGEPKVDLSENDEVRRVADKDQAAESPMGSQLSARKSLLSGQQQFIERSSDLYQRITGLSCSEEVPNIFKADSTKSPGYGDIALLNKGSEEPLSETLSVNEKKEIEEEIGKNIKSIYQSSSEGTGANKKGESGSDKGKQNKPEDEVRENSVLTGKICREEFANYSKAGFKGDNEPECGQGKIEKGGHEFSESPLDVEFVKSTEENIPGESALHSSSVFPEESGVRKTCELSENLEEFEAGEGVGVEPSNNNNAPNVHYQQVDDGVELPTEIEKSVNTLRDMTGRLYYDEFANKFKVVSREVTDSADRVYDYSEKLLPEVCLTTGKEENDQSESKVTKDAENSAEAGEKFALSGRINGDEFANRPEFGEIKSSGMVAVPENEYDRKVDSGTVVAYDTTSSADAAETLKLSGHIGNDELADNSEVGEKQSLEDDYPFEVDFFEGTTNSADTADRIRSDELSYVRKSDIKQGVERPEGDFEVQDEAESKVSVDVEISANVSESFSLSGHISSEEFANKSAVGESQSRGMIEIPEIIGFSPEDNSSQNIANGKEISEKADKKVELVGRICSEELVSGKRIDRRQLPAERPEINYDIQSEADVKVADGSVSSQLQKDNYLRTPEQFRAIGKICGDGLGDRSPTSVLPSSKIVRSSEIEFEAGVLDNTGLVTKEGLDVTKEKSLNDDLPRTGERFRLADQICSDELASKSKVDVRVGTIKRDMEEVSENDYRKLSKTSRDESKDMDLNLSATDKDNKSIIEVGIEDENAPISFAAKASKKEPEDLGPQFSTFSKVSEDLIPGKGAGGRLGADELLNKPSLSESISPPRPSNFRSFNVPDPIKCRSPEMLSGQNYAQGDDIYSSEEAYPRDFIRSSSASASRSPLLNPEDSQHESSPEATERSSSCSLLDSSEDHPGVTSPIRYSQSALERPRPGDLSPIIEEASPMLKRLSRPLNLVLAPTITPLRSEVFISSLPLRALFSFNFLISFSFATCNLFPYFCLLLCSLHPKKWIIDFSIFVTAKTQLHCFYC